PIKPIVMRSLGERVPFRPKAEAGTMAGAVSAAPRAPAVWRKNRRRVIVRARPKALSGKRRKQGALPLALCAPRLPLPALRFPQVVAKRFIDSNKMEVVCK